MSTTLVMPSEGFVPLSDREWPVFWGRLHQVLRSGGYAHGTRMLYRSVLRAFAKQSRVLPNAVSYRHIDAYLHRLGNSRCSAAWLAMNISVLRTVFDKCCGLKLLEHRKGPRRPRRLPVVLSEQEVHGLLRACRCPRDALLLTLLYGCGLKVGEATRLRWGDLDAENKMLSLGQRRLPLPQAVHALVKAGVGRCDAGNWLFGGRRAGRPLNQRTVSRIVREAAVSSGLLTPVTAMVLRHSYAVHQLQAGLNIRELQEHLGHRSVETTMRYLRCIPPVVSSPADALESVVLPEIRTEASEPLFGEEDHRPWFRTWLKSRGLPFLSPRRPPG